MFSITSIGLLSYTLLTKKNIAKKQLANGGPDAMWIVSQHVPDLGNWVKVMNQSFQK